MILTAYCTCDKSGQLLVAKIKMFTLQYGAHASDSEYLTE